MSLLVVGLSYRTAPLALLERAALSAQRCRGLERRLCASGHAAEAVVLSTCNRLEVYAEVGKFHGGVAEVGAGLAGMTGIALDELTDHLYVHYEAAAVQHLFTTVCGLDSMAVGEQQILGQVRAALRGAQECGCAGRSLQSVLQQALRVGKRAHAETGLDRVGHSLVETGLRAAAEQVGPLPGAGVLVVGAGAMSGLAVATALRHRAGRICVANRTPERARRLAAGAGATVVPWEDLVEAVADADVIVSCTGAVGHVIDVAVAGRARDLRTATGDAHARPQVYVDLALPRDVAPQVAGLPGVGVVDLEVLGRRLASAAVATDLADVRALIEQEVEAFLAAQRAEVVAPTVVALRARARSVVEAELARLDARLGDRLDEQVLAEVRQTVHRVVEKLLHTPTVRVKQFAGEPGGGGYAQALRELFDLDLDSVNAVTGAAVGAVAGVGGVGAVGGIAPVGAAVTGAAPHAAGVSGVTTGGVR